MASTEQELFPRHMELPTHKGRGLLKADEVLWFSRLALAVKLKSESKDRELTIWTKRVQLCRNVLCAANIAIAKTFVQSMRKLACAGNTIEDELESEAMEALLRAVDKFKLRFKVRFGTFAYSVIGRAVKRKALKERRLRFKYNPTLSGVAHYDDNRTNDAQAVTEDVEELNRALEACPLSQAERNVLEMRFRAGMKLEAIGDVMHLSKERIRQIQEKALTKLRVEMGVDADE